MSKVCVAGAGGFIASHLAKKLKELGNYVVACDWKKNEYFHDSEFCNEFHLMDLRVYENCKRAVRGCHVVYHLAAAMGGMGFIQSNHSVIMFNNTMISCNLLEAARECGVEKFFFASSACIYPEYKQTTTNLDKGLKESDAWPAQPQDAYGLEKLYTEELCKHYAKDYKMHVRIARFHNIYGPMGTWKGGREKAPAALCRKVAVVNENTNYIEMWGDGMQTRSFMYIDDCVDGIIKLVESTIDVPVNLGSDRMVSINELAEIIQKISQKSFQIKHIPGPMGVRGRNSNNDYVKEALGWEPSVSLEEGLASTYNWICEQIAAEKEVSEYACSKTYQIEHNIPLGSLP
jgi:GDP-D-mannose 3',5'-epimerase